MYACVLGLCQPAVHLIITCIFYARIVTLILFQDEIQCGAVKSPTQFGYLPYLSCELPYVPTYAVVDACYFA